MPILDSKIDTRSEQFQQNRSDMMKMLGLLDGLLEEASEGGGTEAIARLRSRDKMPIRERISHALDRDSPFLEISPLAAWRSPFAIGSGFVVGIGVIENVECVILGHDPSVRAGAFNQFNSKKLMRGLEIARVNRLPYVQFVESAGADLRGEAGEDPEAAIQREGGHFAESGRLFYEITELSKMRIPTISVVFGASTAGGAYQPGMSDYNIFIKNQSKVFLGGVALTKMATGEDANEEEEKSAPQSTESTGTVLTFDCRNNEPPASGDGFGLSSVISTNSTGMLTGGVTGGGSSMLHSNNRSLSKKSKNEDAKRNEAARNRRLEKAYGNGGGNGVSGVSGGGSSILGNQLRNNSSILSVGNHGSGLLSSGTSSIESQTAATAGALARRSKTIKNNDRRNNTLYQDMRGGSETGLGNTKKTKRTSASLPNLHN